MKRVSLVFAFFLISVFCVFSQESEITKVFILAGQSNMEGAADAVELSPADLKDLQNLKIVGDITCDINGSVPTTIRSTTIEEPNYWIERYNLKEIDENNDGIAVMAVDNLPSELPRDSSTEFSEGIINEVLPFLLKEDDGRILNGTITTDGSFLEKYNYLNDYIRINE